MRYAITTALLGMACLGTPASAQSNLYVGLDLMQSYNDFEIYDSGYGKFEPDNESRAFKFKIGTFSNSGWRLQGYYLHEEYDESLFDPTSDTLDEIGIDVIRAYSAGSGMAPFIQGGVGIGSMDLDPAYYDEDTVGTFSLKMGVGVLFWISPAIDLLAGVDVQYRGWEDLRYGPEYVETDETSTRVYLGINVYF